MKHIIFYWYIPVIAGVLALLASCDYNPVRSLYRPVLPDLPSAWEEILGEAEWRLEWINESGAWQEGEGRIAPDISIQPDWATPVIAWPFWSEKGLLPGAMKPSGALFPWDVSGETIVLSWKGGVETVFWKEMAAASRSAEAANNRLPWYFDWPRFRELMENDAIPGNVRQNPWLADWKDIAAKTVLSGFDRRRISSRPSLELVIPGMDGRWIGSSPFMLPLEAGPGGSLSLNVFDEPDVWVSTKAVLKCSRSGWVYRKL